MPDHQRFRFQGGLVDLDRGLVSRDIFVDPDIYALEQDRVFARAWLFVGHESQVPEPGDYALSRMGEESVILNRDMDGRLHVFLNTCRHRGMRVCRYDSGNAHEFTCPYHGWVYGADGTLTGVPQFRAGYHSELDRAAWGLIEAARLDTYNETIWASWDAAAPPLLDFFGGARSYLDNFLMAPDGGNGKLEVIGGIHKWIIPCNWKFGAENFAGDYYHGISHDSVDRLALSPSGKKGRHTFDAIKLRTTPTTSGCDGWATRRGCSAAAATCFPTCRSRTAAPASPCGIRTDRNIPRCGAITWCRSMRRAR
jgi:phenylpropionate dioxygenase-like ring-hydroxylating dioxygenase large terminal subunit